MCVGVYSVCVGVYSVCVEECKLGLKDEVENRQHFVGIFFPLFLPDVSV